MMRYLSVCSGIEAASVAWESLGWQAAGFSEIEAFPSAVLSHRFPGVRNFGDFTQIIRSPEMRSDAGDVSLVVGGTPCQSFSVAGLRRGLSDERGNLALEFMRLVGELRPRWLLWENVPGVLSSNGGRDFGAILGALGQLGYGFAWRVLDAQHFGVPQRRRRVFLVGHSGGRPDGPAQVLFERESVRGHFTESGKTRKGASSRTSRRAGVGGSAVGTLTARYGSKGPREVEEGLYLPSVVGTLTARFGNNPMGAPEIDGGMYIPARPWPADVACTLNATFGSKQGLEDQHALGGASLFVPATHTPVAFHHTQTPIHGAVTPCLSKSAGGMGVSANMGVRRLTPTECERLQGFPDGWTDVPHRGKPAPDGPRYKALGNSMAVPVMRWIGERIAKVDARHERP